jgi:hypothetical protein
VGTMRTVELFRVMEITLVKAGGPGERDRAYLDVDGVVRRGPVSVVHDLPHLVVESLFGIDDGLRGELAAGSHAAPGQAMTARDPERQKLGRIVSGAAAGAPTEQWLTRGPRRAAWHTTRSLRQSWHQEGNEQFTFPPLPGRSHR